MKEKNIDILTKSPVKHHCHGGKVESCKFYDQYFDYRDIEYWRSVGSRVDVFQNIEAFLLPDNTSNDLDPYLDMVFHYLDDLCFDELLTPLSIANAIKHLPNNTSPGFPYVKSELKTKEEAKPFLHSHYIKAIRKKSTHVGSFDEPCLAALRLALAKKPRNKPRFVWVYPAVMATAEARFFMPLMVRMFKCLLFSWDFSFLRGEYAELQHFCQKSTVYGTDVSGFDASVSSHNIRRIFSWFKTKFTLNSIDRREFDMVEDYFINTPLWYEDGIYIKHKGVPSGSYFTQLVDSIVNLAYQAFLLSEMRGRMIDSLCDFAFIRVLGDDSLIAIEQAIPKTQFDLACDKISSVFNVQIHPAKGFYSCCEDEFEDRKEFEFLGFGIDFFAPIHFKKDKGLILAQCLFPEEREKNPAYSMARLIGIKWSIGDDPDLLSIPNYFWFLLKERYPNVTPTEIPREYRLFFRYVLGNVMPESLTLPDDQVVINRYRCAQSVYLMKLYHNNNYHCYVRDTWCPLVSYRSLSSGLS